MYRIQEVGGTPGGEAFLLTSGGRSALLDTGFSYCAEALVQNIRSILGKKPLDLILLTHSHYDHVCGTMRCLREWPDAAVIASGYTKYVFTRPSALNLMRKMSAAAVAAGSENINCDVEHLRVDRTVAEGDLVELGNLHLRVMETPGHTKCCISFFSEGEGLFLASETLGLFAAPSVVKPTYLVGYRMTLDSIAKAAACRPNAILVPHMGLIGGEDGAEYLRASRFWAEKVQSDVVSGHFAGKSREKLTEELIARFLSYDRAQGKPESAVRLNAGITVDLLLRECTLQSGV